MNLHSATDRTERSRIERGIRKNDLSLSKIREDRRRLALGLAEFKLLSRLAGKQIAGRPLSVRYSDTSELQVTSLAKSFHQISLHVRPIFAIKI